MKLITRRTIIKELAAELAYLQISADWWYYTMKDTEENRNMASGQLELVTEVKEIANRLGILKQVYKKAYQIYDFRNSGKKGYNPDIELIKRLNREFCEPRKKSRIFI